MSFSRCGKESRRSRAAGLTLLELIVALGILAVMSTIAVRALDPLADQARFEATQRLLDDMRDATIGTRSARQADGQPLISGFLADTGSLPTSLNDFTEVPAGLIVSGNQSFDSDRDTVDDVSLISGWRGPYLHLGAGQTTLLDGWGRAPLIELAGGDCGFVSLGSDNDSVAPEDSYAADLATNIVPTDYMSTVTFRLFAIDGMTGTRADPAPAGLERLAVLLYSVNGDGGNSGAIEESILPVASAGTFEVARANFVHGRAAARAIQWSDNDADNEFDSGESLILSSYVHYFTVTSGADSRIEMELR